MIEPLLYCKVCGMTMQCIADFYKENKCRPLVLEIGCADGEGTMRYAGFCDQVLCVDPMVQGRPDIFSVNRDIPVPADPTKLELFRRRTQEFPVQLVVGCSLWKETLVTVEKTLKGRPVDILVIDGCHHPFEAVWGDFEAYTKFVPSGGFVIFDDLYEECILQAYQKAQELGYVEHDRWAIKKETALQDVGALRKP